MKRMIFVLLLVVVLALSGTALTAARVKTHTAWWWFSLPDDGWNWPIYILDVGNPGQASVAITFTLKDWSFVPLETREYTINPKGRLSVTLSDLWPSHFNYSLGGIDITDYIIEVKVTERQIDQYFRAWPEIDACFNEESPTFDSNECSPGYTCCYARYFGIFFGKLPKQQH
ncbi:MAG: hypothetical protein ABSB22_01305 [Thermodesulfobacteriota bacterium]